MSTRISSAALALAPAIVLAACGGPVQPQAAEGAQRIDCAVGPGTELGPNCLVEREVRAGATLLVVRRPDGGFRRFVQSDDGSGLVAADGADEVTSRLDGTILDVTVANERYRFPAREIADE